jgi:hypothetical protein
MAPTLPAGASANYSFHFWSSHLAMLFAMDVVGTIGRSQGTLVGDANHPRKLRNIFFMS